MRIHTTIVTKDHFIIIVKATHKHDELYAAEGFPPENPIGFLSEGTAITFKKDALNGSWTKYADSISGPNLHIRSIFSLFGAVVSENENLTYVTIIPRSDGSMELLEDLGQNINSSESEMIINSDTAFQIGSQCASFSQRDLDTFDSGTFDATEDVGEIEFDGI